MAVGGATAYELVDHGILPGKQRLDELDGACSVPAPTLSFAPLGPSFSDQFFSSARGRSVGYTIAYPPGHQRGDQLSLIVVLHGYGDNHVTALKGMTPAQAVALRPQHEPMAMVVEELIPMCQGLGLGRQPQQIKLMGISMGGFGALAIAESVPHLIHGVAAISPAIWTTYDQAQEANPNAFASRRSFEHYDVISHAEKLAGLPLRVAVGTDDPFFPGVKTFVEAVPHPERVVFDSGCHTNSFFLAQEPPSIQFLSRYVVHG